MINELKCWITRRYNGLYLVTGFKPVICEVVGVGHEDAYIKHGDPVGYINIPYNFGVQIFDDPPYEPCVPERGILYGSMHGPMTHVVEGSEVPNLYTIYQDSKTYIPYVCQWFITKMFNIKQVFHPQPVTFYGKIGA